MYELHLTVEKPKDIEVFKEVCRSLRIKPLIIATGDYNQVMTSSIYYDNDYIRGLQEIREFLERHGDHKVIREKVEIMPQIKQHPDHIYYESHIRVKIPKDRIDYIQKMLDKKSLVHNLHKSKNLFKIDENCVYQMLTYRTCNSSIWDFGKHIETVKDSLSFDGIDYDKVELEECIYDTNVNIDTEWINNK